MEVEAGKVKESRGRGNWTRPTGGRMNEKFTPAKLAVSASEFILKNEEVGLSPF